MSAPIVGYIIQFLDEELILPPLGAKHLFLTFTEAMTHAKSLYESYMETCEDGLEGPFELYKPTKQTVDLAGASLIFRSRDIHIWIDCILA